MELINDTNQMAPPESIAAVQSKRYLTGHNQFVYITYSHVGMREIAPVKIQVFQRVTGGVEETIYRLFGDQRFTRENNAMIFGDDSDAQKGTHVAPVTETEAADLVAIIDSLNPDNERLQWGDNPGNGQGGGVVDAMPTLDDGAIS